MLVFFQRELGEKIFVYFISLFVFFLNSIYLNSTTLTFMFLVGFNINAQNSNIILCKLFLNTTILLITLYPTILFLTLIDRLLISSQNV